MKQATLPLRIRASVPGGCSYHDSVAAIMRCQRCARTLYEHLDRIARLENR